MTTILRSDAVQSPLRPTRYTMHAMRCGIPLVLTLAVGGYAGPVWGAMPRQAQTMYARLWTPVDLAAYPTVELCLAATERVAGIVSNSPSRATDDTKETLRWRASAGIWRDTMPRDPRIDNVHLLPFSDSVQANAKRCSAKFVEPKTSLEVADWSQEMYLQANRDADAAAVVARQLAALSPKDSAARKDALASAYYVYLKARPIRWTEAEAQLAAWTALESDPLWRILAEAQIPKNLPLFDCLTKEDSARVLRHHGEIERLALGLTAQDRARLAALPQWTQGEIYGAISAAVDARHMPSFLDSLRMSTAAYVRYRITLMTRALGNRNKNPNLNGVGEQLPAMAVRWFRRDTSVAWPTRGQVGITYFVDPASPDYWPPPSLRCLPIMDTRIDLVFEEKCRESFAPLRRLKQYFPGTDVDVTSVAWLRGYVVYGTQETAAEAELARHYLHDVHKLPGALAVTPMTYVRLPQPDNRRIERQDRVSREFDVVLGQMILSDRAGVQVYRESLSREKEPEFRQVIQALREQQPLVETGAGGAAGTGDRTGTGGTPARQP